MLPWLTITPFGVPVEPDVYCSKARVADVTSASGGSPASTRSSVAVHRKVAKYGCRAMSGCTIASVWAVVNAWDAAASAMMASIRGTCDLLRGGYAGTAISPA